MKFLLKITYFYQIKSRLKAGDSCINQLVSITQDICNSFNEGYDVRDVRFNRSKAFDEVWHKGFLFKLKQNGMSDNLLSIMRLLN